MAFLESKGVDIWFRSGKQIIEALKSIDLDIDEGQFVCIVGPSGCGKSTFLHLVAGFVEPSHGQVSLDGRIIRGPGADRTIVMQRPLLLPWMTVYDNVALGPRVRGFTSAKLKETVNYYLDLVNLAEFATRKPYELSGGMQQRAAVARALANDSRVLLMDEPFGALDALTREKMQLELLRIWAVTGKTILFVTHDVEEAVACGTRVLVMTARPGKVALDSAMSFSKEIVDKGISMTNLRAIKSTNTFVEMRERVMAPILKSAGYDDE